MLISLIAAMSENAVIGKDNALPWNYPEDLKYFKKMTLGKPIVMGRRTFESMKSRPLPDRHNIILTQDPSFRALGCTVVYSEIEAIQAAGDSEELMIIGGATIYKLFLPLASRLYLTMIHKVVKGDTYFPSVNWKEWNKVSEEDHDELTWLVYDRL